jgi:hypothetical protein
MSEFEPTGQSERDFERSLLDSARHDVTPRNVQTAWADFAGAMGLATASVETGSGLFRVETTRAHATSSFDVVGGKIAAWVLLGALGGSALTAAFLLERREPSVAVQANQWPVLTTPMSIAVGINALPSVPDAPEPANASSVPVSTRRIASRANADAFDPAEVPSRPPTSTLAAEVKRLDTARIACRAGAYDEALRLVESYHREFPRGVLGPDAEVVALEALVEKREANEVAQRAAAFLAQYPSDPHAAKVRRWAEQVGAE